MLSGAFFMFYICISLGNSKRWQTDDIFSQKVVFDLSKPILGWKYFKMLSAEIITQHAKNIEMLQHVSHDFAKPMLSSRYPNVFVLSIGTPLYLLTILVLKFEQVHFAFGKVCYPCSR